MNKKAIVAVVFIVLALLGAGVWLYSRYSTNSPSVESKQIPARADDTKQNIEQQPAQPTQSPIPSLEVINHKADLEELIKTTIAEKQAKLDQTSPGRSLTDDEKDFLANPRTNAIKELSANGKISSQDADLLNK